MAGNRAAPDPALSDVVRDRLAALLAEVPARRVIVSSPTEGTDAEPLSAGVAADDDPERAGRVEVGQPSLAQVGRAAWEFTRSHLLVVGIVLLTGCLWAGYNVLQARSSPVAQAPSATPSVVVSSPSPSPTPTPAVVFVHVLGAVAHPGVVSLPEGARVQDAIAAAGGLRSDAAPGELNLAAIVVDGSQVVIGNRGSPRGEVRAANGDAPAAGGASNGGDAKVSLNAATQAELETLPGVGPVTAQKILAWRQDHGAFSRVEELQEVDGIGPKTYGELAPHVRV